MAIIFKTEERRIIPRLRSFDLSSTTGELSLQTSTSGSLKFDKDKFLDEQNEAWKKNKTLAHASDLLSSAFVLGFENDYKDVAEFVLNSGEVNDKPIGNLAKKILTLIETTGFENSEHVVDDIKIRSDIKVLKHILNQEPKNPIAWMEIGRLYSLLGQMTKADNAVEMALRLDKNNRFIVRSASRYYHHFSEEKDKPLYVIRKSEYAKNDPWLISADIAYSTILGRYSKVSKIGEELIKHKTYGLSSTTELSSALGTLEYNNGKIKEARKYLTHSLQAPNENSLAQVAWMSENINGINIENSKYDLPLAYEANSLRSYEVGEFKRAYDEAMNWHSDEPFSTRPIKVASYIASVFLKEHKISIQLTKRALELTPGDVLLLNNLVYFLIQNGEIEEAEKIFVKTLTDIIDNPEKHSDREKIICTATAGLIAFKNKNIEAGNKYYEKAIAFAKSSKSSYLIGLATANYVKEAIAVIESKEEISKLTSQLKDTCKYNEEPDIKQIYDEVMLIAEAKLSVAN
jgi:Tfp pilus assembly protein PilF